MYIHVVTSGESLWVIAQRYQVPYQIISEANQLENPERLVVGQALVIPIPGYIHWVQPGESLWKISHYYQKTIEKILSMNQLTNMPYLPVGYPLIIPGSFENKLAVDVAAYVSVPMSGEESPDFIRQVGDNLTYVQVFTYEMNVDGTLTPLDDEAIIEAALENDIIPMMVITNIEEGAFSTELITTILENEELRNRILDEAIEIMEEKGYLGVDFDLEFLGEENRERYNEFMRRAKELLDERGYILSSALAPKTSAEMEGILYEGHDYAAHGDIADFVFLMTYEWGWSGGPPRAVAPINEVRRVIEFAVTVMPANKIMMGIPLYGYDWTLPFVEGETRARAIDHQQAIALAIQYNAEIEYDLESQSSHFTYYDEEGREHEVWFEDARSMQVKFDLVKEFNLRGFFYWVLGWEFPQNWLLVQENFDVNKRI